MAWSNVVISILFVIGTTKVSSEYLVNPTIVKEGYDLILQCNATTNATVRWIHNIEVISNNRDVTLGSQTEDGRYDIVGSNPNEFNLQITDITLNEGGTYTCSYDSGEVLPRSLAVISADAPTEGPICTSSIPLNSLVEGGNCSLICQSIGGDPTANLVWSRLGIDIAATDIETADGIDLSYSIILGPQYQGAQYTCTADHPTYDTPRSCEIGPLSISLNQRVFVTLAPETIELQVRQEGTFECSAEGDPPVTSYSWKYGGATINRTDSRFHIDPYENTLTVVSASNNMDGGTIQCLANNGIDTRYASATITIIPTPSDEGPSFVFIAAIVGLILLLVLFVCCIIPLIAYRCYKKILKDKLRKRELKKKQRKLAKEARLAEGDPAMGINYYVTSDDLGRGRRKHRKKKSRVIKHNVVSPNQNGKTHYSVKNQQYPDEEESEGYIAPVDSRTDRQQSPDRNERTRSLSPRRGHSGRGSSHGRSKSEDGKRKPRSERVSLSPGEYFKRAEVEDKLHEIEDLERSITLPHHSRSRRKHRKKSRHSRSRSQHKRDESQESEPVYQEAL